MLLFSPSIFQDASMILLPPFFPELLLQNLKKTQKCILTIDQYNFFR
jgi:hypothetical protein